MTDVRDLHARVVQIADTINNYADRPTSERAESGLALLRKGLYADSAQLLRDRLVDDPNDQAVHFAVALAMLQGRRPHRQAEQTIRAVLAHLRSAPDLAESCMLELLVDEDRGLHWRRADRAIPPVVTALAERVPSEQAELILQHVPAVEARTWRALRAAHDTRSMS